MKRRPVNFKKSAASFKKKAATTNAQNQPNYRTSRGGIRK